MVFLITTCLWQPSLVGVDARAVVTETSGVMPTEDDSDHCYMVETNILAYAGAPLSQLDVCGDRTQSVGLYG